MEEMGTNDYCIAYTKNKKGHLEPTKMSTKLQYKDIIKPNEGHQFKEIKEVLMSMKDRDTKENIREMKRQLIELVANFQGSSNNKVALYQM